MLTTERLRALYTIAKSATTTHDTEVALPNLLRETAQLLQAERGRIVTLNPTMGQLETLVTWAGDFWNGTPEAMAPISTTIPQSIAGWTARNAKPSLSVDTSSDPRCVGMPETARSMISYPIEIEGLIRGVIDLESSKPSRFHEDDIETLGEIAAIAAALIDSTWRFQQQQKRAAFYEGLVRIGKALNSTQNLEEILSVVTQQASALLNGKLCSVLIAEGQDNDSLRIAASHGAGPAYAKRTRIRGDETLMGVVMRKRRPIQIEDVQTSHLYTNTQIAKVEGLHSLLSAPLQFEDQVSGAINLYTAAPHSFSNEEIQTLTALSELCSVAIQKTRILEMNKRTEEKLRESERLSALGLLAAEVAHEIRNPLTVMKMLYHSLDLRFPDEDPRREDARILREKMESLNHIVERILKFAKNSEPVLRATDINHLLRDLFRLLSQKLERHHISLTSELHPSLPKLLVDAQQVEQVFLNVLLNAAESMPSGGELFVRTSSRRKAGRDCVEIAVRDTGLGMDADERERLFTSILSSNKRDGVGLGMAIVSKILEAHNADIDIWSAKGEGTEVRLIFPIEG